jgi:hypothetical protein
VKTYLQLIIIIIIIIYNNASDKYEWITTASSLYLPSETSREIGATN